MSEPILIVGCGPGAPEYVTPATREAVAQAEVLVAAPHLQRLFSEAQAERIELRGSVAAVLDQIAALRERRVVVAVSGDPGVSSLAQPVIRRFGPAACRVLPGISSVQVAFARLGLPWEEARIVSAHSRRPEADPAEVAAHPHIAILGGSPEALQFVREVLALCPPRTAVFVCSDLTLPSESVRAVPSEELASLATPSRTLFILSPKEVLP